MARSAMGFQLQRVDTMPAAGALKARAAAFAISMREQLAEARIPMPVVARRAGASLEACGVPPLALLLPVSNTLIALIWLQFSVLTPKAYDSILAMAIFAGFAGATVLASWIAVTRAVAAVLGTIAVVFGGFAATSLPSALGVATGGPLWDATFLRFDRMLGFDHAAVYDWVVHVPILLKAMDICYGLTVLYVLLTGIVLVVLKRWDRLREFNLIFAVSLTIVVAVAALTPAAGLMTEVRFTTAALMAFPEGSGTYHLDLFHALRAGMPIAYGPFDNPGVIVFPSFHTCMALLVAYGLRDDPVLRWPTRIYCVITLVATVPFGSHYVADVVGGAVIFAATAWWVSCGRKFTSATPT